MRFTLAINLDNAAFDVEDEDTREPRKNTATGAELARILRRLAVSLDASDAEKGDTYTVHDTNGNKVGAGSITGRR